MVLMSLPGGELGEKRCLLCGKEGHYLDACPDNPGWKSLTEADIKKLRGKKK